MKYRNGFVSNSSSSSFVCICPSNLNRSNFTKEENILFDAIFRKNIVLGKEAYTASERVSSEEFWETCLCECYLEQINHNEEKYDEILESKIYDTVWSLIRKIKADNSCFCEELDG